MNCSHPQVYKYKDFPEKKGMEDFKLTTENRAILKDIIDLFFTMPTFASDKYLYPNNPRILFIFIELY